MVTYTRDRNAGGWSRPATSAASWLADEIRTLHVRTNGDTRVMQRIPKEVRRRSIGLCRTEHVRATASRVREMIISDTLEQRKAALAKILPMQRAATLRLSTRAMGGLPVTIRLFNPPLHEFLPHEDDEISELADERAYPSTSLGAGKPARVQPDAAHCCRLDVPSSGDRRDADRGYRIRSYQCLEGKTPALITPETAVPLVSEVNSCACGEHQGYADELTGAVRPPAGGCCVRHAMIETPRAAVTAGDGPRKQSSSSFGTNDLYPDDLRLSA